MNKLLFSLTFVWLVAAGAGIQMTTEYESTPGELRMPPSRWPSRSSLKRSQSEMKLLVFLHPRCVCSDATLTELEHLMVWVDGRFAAQVVSVEPSRRDREWEHSATIKRARSIRGVELVHDRGGLEADTFRAMTSGFAVLYSGDGALLFSGGITGGRGVTGENGGLQALQAAVLQGLPATGQSPAFGCSLVAGAPKRF